MIDAITTRNTIKAVIPYLVALNHPTEVFLCFCVLRLQCQHSILAMNHSPFPVHYTYVSQLRSCSSSIKSHDKAVKTNLTFNISLIELWFTERNGGKLTPHGQLLNVKVNGKLSELQGKIHYRGRGKVLYLSFSNEQQLFVPHWSSLHSPGVWPDYGKHSGLPSV